jgi:hypothetical protein
MKPVQTSNSITNNNSKADVKTMDELVNFLAKSNNFTLVKKFAENDNGCCNICK